MFNIRETPVFSAFLAWSAAISFIDMRERRIPDVLSFSCFFFILALRIVFFRETVPLSLWTSAGIFLFFALLRAVTGGIGAGDMKLAAVSGLACSFPPAAARAVLYAALLGLGALLPAAGTWRRDDALPFAPFLCAGTVLAMLY